MKTIALGGSIAAGCMALVDDKVMAARVYDAAAIKNFGEFATVNGL